MTETRLAIVWIVLVGATVVSLYTSELERARVAFAIVLAIAYIKVRLVFMEFVGLGSMPRGWRIFLEGWLLAVIAEIGFYHWG